MKVEIKAVGFVVDILYMETCGEGAFSSVGPSAQRNFPSIDDAEVVGFEKDAEIIMKKLTGGTKELHVLSIFGMPGLGKTTLAMKVYNNPSIVGHFDVKVWCAVSQSYNRRTLLAEIFKQATNYNSEIKEDVDIADKLLKALKGKRYLIVLDDIWEVVAWEDLGLCFPNGEYGSRVMVTTRIERVATHLQHCGEPYSLRFLTPEESWELLEKKVFQGESCPPDLLEAGLQVAKHCKGLPLVIVLIAGIIMKMERRPSMWMEIANDLSSYVLGEQSMKVIQSCYDRLEDHLKPCLFYIALYPEDWMIQVSDLMMLWMAEEFVLNVDTQNMEEASRICLNDLLNRSLVMVSLRDYDGDVICCILHDVVREFCLKKLTEEKFMQLTVPYNPYQHLNSMESRWIKFQCTSPIWKQSALVNICPRTLEFIVHPKFYTWNRSNPLALLKKLKLVRVLKFMEVCLPSSWANEVQSLTHLSYLEIYVKEFDFKWISQLLDLQTLIIHSPSTLRTSPGAIWKMTKLRLVQIYELSFVWEQNDPAIFEETSTNMLRELEDIPLPSCPLFPIVEVHTQLQSLSLVTSYKEFWDSVGWESYFVLPSNTRRLYLGGCFLTEGMVSNIARLKKLESLTIKGGFPVRKSENHYWDVTNVEFPSLKILILESVKMNEWEASDGSFPVLEKLYLLFCFYFKEIPPSFADIPTLQQITLPNCSDFLVDSAMNIRREIEDNTGCDSFQLHILHNP
ncbi:hypothetical protein KY285_027524 [Solanum tuberosum]|nr:hypothetical protein KY289_027723 [Solanum tuberosum]KAH0666318.1 hypothetical protein KY285_027524 [Solanum tuberosum]